MIDRLERGAADGELAPGTDVGQLVDLLFGAVFYRSLMSHETTDHGYVTDIVGRVLGVTGR